MDTSQAALLERLRNGDESAFGELVNTHWEKIYRRAHNLLEDRRDAEEVAQDTFIRAKNSIQKFRGECSLSTWLYHIATNLAHNRHWYWWRRKRSSSISLDAPIGYNSDMTVSDVVPEENKNPVENAISNEFAEILPKAIDSLPEKYSEVLKLRSAEDLSYEDIAQKLNLSVGTVKSRLSRAREYLRMKLSE